MFYSQLLEYSLNIYTLSRDEIAQLVAKVLPTIYMAIYNSVIEAKIIR